MIAVADIATDFTLDFVRPQLPPGSIRILEVGCGDGAVAARLEQSTTAVVAIDADEDSVRAARKRGVDARRADWPEFDDGVFQFRVDRHSDVGRERPRSGCPDQEVRVRPRGHGEGEVD